MQHRVNQSRTIRFLPRICENRSVVIKSIAAVERVNTFFLVLDEVAVAVIGIGVGRGIPRIIGRGFLFGQQLPGAIIRPDLPFFGIRCFCNRFDEIAPLVIAVFYCPIRLTIAFEFLLLQQQCQNLFPLSFFRKYKV